MSLHLRERVLSSSTHLIPIELLIETARSLEFGRVVRLLVDGHVSILAVRDGSTGAWCVTRRHHLVVFADLTEGKLRAVIQSSYGVCFLVFSI